MPEERTDAETGREDVSPAANGGPEERAEEAHAEPADEAIDVLRADGTEDWNPELSGAPASLGTAQPPPVPPQAPGWAPQRTIGGQWDTAASDYSAIPRFESAPYVPVPAGPGDDLLGGSEEREPTAEERAAAEAEAAARRRQKTKTLVREVVETVLLALLVFLAVRASFQNFKVEGNSMFPTLDDGEFLIVNKLVYSEVDVDKLSRFIPFLDPGDNPKRWVFHGPERGDIVVLQDPRDPGIDLIKRVVGLPGDRFEIIQGKIFINGLLLEEPYIKSPWRGSLPETTIPPGEYFVMGDNRDNSQDSRSLGLVPKDLIIGKALLAYWPMSDFGLAPNESPKVTDKTVADVYGPSPPRAAAGR